MQKIVKRNKKKTRKLQRGGAFSPRLKTAKQKVSKFIRKVVSKVRSKFPSRTKTIPVVSFENPMYQKNPGVSPTGVQNTHIKSMNHFLSSSPKSPNPSGSISGRFPGINNTTVPANASVRRKIMSARNGTGPSNAQTFLNRARLSVEDLSPNQRQTYRDVLETIKNKKNIYGTGKRTREQQEAMISLARQKGLSGTQFMRLYSQSGTTALLNAIQKTISKTKDEKAGNTSVKPANGIYLNIEPAKSGMARAKLSPEDEQAGYIEPTSKPENTGYMSL